MTKHRIAVVSDVAYGGAGVSARRLHVGLKRVGQSSSWFVGKGRAKGAISAEAWPSLISVITLRIMSVFHMPETFLERFTASQRGKTLQRMIKGSKPSVINLHNLHQSLNAKFLQWLPKDVPVVWTLHDMWALTGYCCYSYECRSYLDCCSGNCPEIGQWGDPQAGVTEDWRRKDNFFMQRRQKIVLVAPSRWLANIAKDRMRGLVGVRHIPNGIDLEVFKPLAVKKQDLRSALGLPRDRQVILIGSVSLNDSRKGIGLFMDAIKIVEDRFGAGAPLVVAFGDDQEPNERPDHWEMCGVIGDEALLNQYYNAADVFVLPSLADNLPNTLIEATSAGTPCVTFDIGGCSEVVRNNQTGCVVKSPSAEELAVGIEKILRTPEEDVRAMSRLCRKVAEEEYSFELQAHRYKELFEELLS